MKKLALMLVTAATLAAAPAFAATSYQVTGPVLAVDSDTITVQKGSEKWVISKGDASVPDSVQVGSKVTIQYTMVAASVTDKTPSTSSSAPTAQGTPSPASANNSLGNSTLVTKPGMRH